MTAMQLDNNIIGQAMTVAPNETARQPTKGYHADDSETHAHVKEQECVVLV